jgi:hypothetical protein
LPAIQTLVEAQLSGADIVTTLGVARCRRSVLPGDRMLQRSVTARCDRLPQRHPRGKLSARLQTQVSAVSSVHDRSSGATA